MSNSPNRWGAVIGSPTKQSIAAPDAKYFGPKQRHLSTLLLRNVAIALFAAVLVPVAGAARAATVEPIAIHFFWSEGCPHCEEARPIVEAAAESIRGLNSAASDVERPASLGELTLSVTPRGPIDADTARRYQDLGVDRLILLPQPAGEGSADDMAVRFIEETATALGLG